MQLLPPLNTLLVWHISHSTACTGAAGAGRSAGAGGSASIHQSETRLGELGRATGGFGSGSTAIAECVPEVSRVVVEDPGRMGQDGGATGTLPHRLGSVVPRCLSCYSGE